MPIRKYLAVLGFKVTDLVTGFHGVVTSVTFDLYGCVQGLVNPGVGQDGKTQDSVWFDIGRLKIESDEPVMTTPVFEFGDPEAGTVEQSGYLKGPAEKPMQNKA